MQVNMAAPFFCFIVLNYCLLILQAFSFLFVLYWLFPHWNSLHNQILCFIASPFFLGPGSSPPHSTLIFLHCHLVVFICCFTWGILLTQAQPSPAEHVNDSSCFLCFLPLPCCIFLPFSCFSDVAICMWNESNMTQMYECAF